ncbi:MAG: ribbon-helix-helix protein, CopG family [Proteobacteria bacterium]|nr:ribbon-helix-helix protein, CopG family [Pseudomonadota bacterium]
MSKRTICFEAPDELIENLDRLAEAHGISRSDVIRGILKTHVAGSVRAHEPVIMEAAK